MSKKIVQGDLLYHSVHGLCRVKEIIEQGQSNKKALYYSLVPKLNTQMKVRFVIAVDDIEISGFHLLVSLKEANEILEYLKTDEADPSDFDQDNQTWALAKSILSFSHDKSEARDQRKRQILERSANGLVRELAFVLEIPVKESAAKVRKSLQRTSKINPLVLTALEHAGED